MIDLKKPLEGVPGLLLMGALILFGAAAGMGVAIGFTWIPMSGELANFLGGVVGAGLGAALAVMGAVYVQRRDRRDRLQPSWNELRLELDDVSHRVALFQHTLRRHPNELYPDESLEDFEASVLREANKLISRIEAVPPFVELPRSMVDWIGLSKTLLRTLARGIVMRHEWAGSEPPDVVFDKSLDDVEKMLSALKKLRERVARSEQND